MKAILGGAIAGLLVLVFCRSVPAEEEKTPLSPGMNRFALELYGQLRAEEGNLFLSPFSISSALAMTYTGAGGETALQMAKTLHLPDSFQETAENYRALLGELQPAGKEKKLELRIANRLWGQEGYGFRKEYLKLTREYFGAALAELNFAETERARRAINLWVNRMTWGKIRDLIGPGVLDASTRLVLTNAIYFKGEWARRFKKEKTQKKSFFVAPGRSLKVPFMEETADFKYLENDSFCLLELPYVGEEFSLLIFLPRKVDGLASLEGDLTGENLKEWQAGLRKRKLNIFLPKFKLTSRFNLNSPLKKLGMRDAFSARADFSGISGRKDLYISDVIHQAFLEVDEKGSEAAAATAVVMRMTAMPSRPRIFRADHPFLFLIRHNPTGTILFLGRLAAPVQ